MKTTSPTAILLSVTAIAVMLCGCIPSLHPLYTAADIRFEPLLLGIWEPQDSTETWEFRRAEDLPDRYLVIHTDKHGIEGRYEGVMLQLGPAVYLDIRPLQDTMAGNDFFKFHCYRMHGFIRIGQFEPTLKLAMMDPEWLLKEFKNDPALLAHEKHDDDRYVLTASTADLQAFFLEHQDNGRMFTKYGVLTRIADAGGN